MQEFLYVVIALAIVGLIGLTLKPKKYPNGITIPKAKKYLEENTHCGKYWGVKAQLDRKKEIVYVHMSGNERVELDLKTGAVTRTDLD